MDHSAVASSSSTLKTKIEQRQAQVVHAEVGLVGIAADLEGVVSGTEEPGVLSRPGERALHQERGQVDAAGQAVVARAEVVQGRGVAGPVVARGHLVELIELVEAHLP